jgi:hypothetical protein
MRSAGTDACSTAPTEARRDACAEASVPAAKVTMKVRTSPGAAGSLGAGVGSSEGADVLDGAGSVGSLVGAALGAGDSVASEEGAPLSLGGALGEASWEGDGSGSVASAASGDMIVETKTTKVKKTKTLRVVDWRAAVGTNETPRRAQLAGRHGPATANGRLASTFRHPGRYGFKRVLASTDTDR